MSERFFDNLARTLASPMPRRRALRLAGAAIVAAAAPGLRPRPAFGQSPCGPDTPCSSLCHLAPHVGACGIPIHNDCGQELCHFGFGGCMVAGQVCCTSGPDPWICEKNERCGAKARECIAECPSGQKCGDNCCVPPDEECIDGECVPCRTKCGRTCCEEGQVCKNPKTGLCCGANWVSCEAGAAGIVKCCPPRNTCAVSFRTKTAKCCGPKQKAVGATCTCPKKGDTPCGDDCCTTSETCSKGTCCPRGKVNCGNGQCCKPSDCCGKTCCEGKNVCANGQCCPPARSIGRGKGARCCPPGTIAITNGPTGRAECCPPNDPSCCQSDPNDSGATSVLCRKGQTCVAGACAKL